MNQSNWGYVFRELREAKNFSLSKAAGDYQGSTNYITSKVQVSRFERGISDITLTKISGLLENIGVSFEEYLYHIRSYEQPREISLVEHLGRFQELNQLDKIEEQHLILANDYQKTKQRKFYWLALEFKAYLALKNFKDYEIKAEEINAVSDYLFSVLEWGESEIFLFGEFIPFLSEKQVFDYAKEVVNRTEFYRQFPQHKQQVVLMIRDCALYFIDKTMKEEANELLKDYKNLIASPIVDVYNRKEYKFVEGKYLLMVGKKQEAQQIFEFLAQMYELLDYPETAEMIRKIVTNK
ncbi:Rgg/GadR/MutR family transcriptional regulator [Lactococcus allomyrinae]|uniref:Rgg/GadR/MutR family transcriptional regulator n=2 Tax=Lactococcus allomyrinae TaxID=2419773 RepID=A0A387BLN3_9LACT|nr:Rgg/GadR/MutR family transcriptional regulator [Lactococcus allomyrinae]